MRDSPFCLLHGLGDLAAQSDDSNFVDAVARRPRRSRFSPFPAQQDSIDIPMQDLALGSASLNTREIDAESGGPRSYGRSGGGFALCDSFDRIDNWCWLLR
jgi:hypothetical protein